MTTLSRRHFGFAATAGALGLLASACARGEGTTGSAGASDAGTSASTVTVEDNHGTHTVATPLTSVVAADNNSFQTLADWGVTLAAAPRTLMPTTISYKADESIVDLGNHREPNLEAVVAVEPELIITGSRFAQYRDDFASLVPDAEVLDLDARDGQPFDAELKRRVDVLGTVFAKQAQASALGEALDAAVARVKGAYQPGQRVMSVIVSGGEIGYSAPHVGRTFGPVYDVLGLTPALELEGADDDHQGDDISVEAIAASNPDWILVMDRDAAIATEDSQPAAEVIEHSEALRNVTAITAGHVVYMPDDTYTNEGIETYTEFFGTFADALEASR